MVGPQEYGLEVTDGLVQPLQVSVVSMKNLPLAIYTRQALITGKTVALNRCATSEMPVHKFLEGLGFQIVYHLHMGKQRNILVGFGQCDNHFGLAGAAATLAAAARTAKVAIVHLYQP